MTNLNKLLKKRRSLSNLLKREKDKRPITNEQEEKIKNLTYLVGEVDYQIQVLKKNWKNNMITLDEIFKDVGSEVFGRMYRKSCREFKVSPYLYRGADAEHAFIYEEMVRQYGEWKKRDVEVESTLSQDGRHG